MVKNLSCENNNILVEPYKSDRALKPKTTSGFATVAQKSNLVGLRVIVGNSMAKKDWTAYFKEEDLHTMAWAKTVFNCADVGQPFIIADQRYIVMLDAGENND